MGFMYLLKIWSYGTIGYQINGCWLVRLQITNGCSVVPRMLTNNFCSNHMSATPPSTYINVKSRLSVKNTKVQIFWESHKTLEKKSQLFWHTNALSMYSKASRYTASSCTDLDNVHFWIGSKNICDARFCTFCTFLHVFARFLHVFW